MRSQKSSPFSNHFVSIREIQLRDPHYPKSPFPQCFFDFPSPVLDSTSISLRTGDMEFGGVMEERKLGKVKKHCFKELETEPKTEKERERLSI